MYPHLILVHINLSIFMNLPLVMYTTLQIKTIYKKYDTFVKYKINIQTVQNVTIGGVTFRQINSSIHNKHKTCFAGLIVPISFI